MDATEHTIEIGNQHIADQNARIERQRDLIRHQQNEGNGEAAEPARKLLAEMMDLLTTMQRDVAAAQQRADTGIEPLDEASLDRVMRDCPL